MSEHNDFKHAYSDLVKHLTELGMSQSSAMKLKELSDEMYQHVNKPGKCKSLKRKFMKEHTEVVEELLSFNLKYSILPKCREHEEAPVGIFTPEMTDSPRASARSGGRLYGAYDKVESDKTKHKKPDIGQGRWG